jgi:hypothetical protein
VSRYESREELADKAGWEGGPAELVFGYGLSPDDLPGGTPPDVVAAVTRLATQATADLETFRTWLDAPAGGPAA